MRVEQLDETVHDPHLPPLWGRSAWNRECDSTPGGGRSRSLQDRTIRESCDKASGFLLSAPHPAQHRIRDVAATSPTEGGGVAFRVPRLFALVALLISTAPASAAPRDELLRVAPPDAALLLIVQNGRDHVETLVQSPFARWLPQSALGKQLLGADLKQARAGIEPLFNALGIKPEELLADVLGDAVAFAYTPSPAEDMKGERAVALIRPRKPETLVKLLAKLNEIQMGSGEVKSVVSKRHRGEEYFERVKPAGGSDFYCFRGGVFAFSGTEPDIQAVIERDKAGEAKPELAAKLAKLGVGESFAVALINPRPFDREVAAKVAKAQPGEKVLLERFQQAWLALDSAAVDLALGADLELGVSIQFQPGKAPAFLKGWLTGPRQNPALWQAIPENALVAFAGRFKASEVLEAISNVAPADGPNTPKSAAEQLLGPVFGKDKLPQILAALGPNWAVWAEPPGTSGFLPVVVAAVQIDSTGPKGKEAARDITRAVGFGFNAARVAYNSSHADQIEIVETEDGDGLITSLVNEKGFPAGLQPSYAFKAGYLVVASSPDAIKRFREPKPGPATGEATLARFSAAASREYLHKNGGELAKFLAAAGHGEEKALRQQFEQVAAMMEVLDRVEVVSRGDANGLRLAARIRFVKPLKK